MAVEVEVKSQLQKLVEDLEKIQKASDGVSQALKKATQSIGDESDKQVKRTKSGLEQLASFGRSVSDRLVQDFSKLASISSLVGGLSIANQFKGSVDEAINLSDAVRRFGSVFGIAKSDFASFQSALTSGLGEIGASSDAAANALKGLAETPVRGQQNLIAYAKTATQLASISGERGSEAGIASGTAGIITSQGGNANDLNQLAAVTRQILQIRDATGKPVSQITSALSNLYAGTNRDFQGSLRGGGATTLATASLMGGPQATSFLESFMKMDRIQRMGLSAQGFNVFGANGQLDSKAIQGTISEAKRRGLGDAQAGLKTFGITGDDATGFIRLAEALKNNQAQIEGAKTRIVDLNAQFQESRGLVDSFSASMNRVKGMFSDFTSAITQGTTTGLGAASKTDAGSAAVVTGGATTAALLTGGGLSGLGAALGGTGTAATVAGAAGGLTAGFLAPIIAAVMSAVYNAQKGFIVPTGIPGTNASSFGNTVTHKITLEKGLKATKLPSRGY
jgi:hypothetical protein